jgi:hypothetical protein
MDMSDLRMSSPLWKHVGELGGLSATLLYLADVGSDRLSLTQAAFFLLAATADVAGRPATRAQLMQTYPDSFRGSARNSYRQLLEPSRVYPNALAWLRAEENPDDLREQFLRLTDEGRSVIQGALMALTPLERPARSRKNN